MGPLVLIGKGLVSRGLTFNIDVIEALGIDTPRKGK